MIWLDVKFVGLVSVYLDRFQQKNDFNWYFRCPLCGDSQKNKNKTRGNIYRPTNANNLNFNCFNCHASMSLGNFIKEVAPTLYKEYVMERFKEGANGKKAHKEPEFKFNKPKFKTKTKIELPSIADLPEEHYAKEYLISRKIHEKFFKDLYYAEEFGKWVNDICETDKYENILDDKERIAIPFFDYDGTLIGGQGRSLIEGGRLRYMTFRVKPDYELKYGMERWDKSKKTYIVEGPFDSMFLPNCLASCNNSLHVLLKKLRKNLTITDCTLVFDNERRNKEILKSIKSAIDYGASVCLWPDSIKSKDINEMILSNELTPETLINTIDRNTYSGLEAQIKFSDWKKRNV